MELQHLIMDGMIDMARQTLIVESINGEICISHDGIDFKISSVSGEIKASNVNAAKMIITSIQSRKVRQHELDIPPCLFD